MADTLNLDSPDDVALADKMNEGRKQILAELHKRIIGQHQVMELVLQTLFVGGNSLIIGVPGLAKTLLIQTLAQVLELKFTRIQFTPDLMPSDITGTDIINEDPGTGRRQMVFAPGPDLQQHRPGGRNQPHTAEDAGRAARGDAGASRHDPGTHLQAGRTVLRLRDAEPDRARRHVPPSGSAARSLHVPHSHGAPARGRGVDGRARDDRHHRSALQQADQRRRPDRVPAAGAARAGGGSCAALCALDRANEPAEGAQRARVGEQVGGLRRVGARRAVPGARRQGEGAHQRALPRELRRHPRRWRIR